MDNNTADYSLYNLDPDDYCQSNRETNLTISFLNEETHSSRAERTFADRLQVILLAWNNTKTWQAKQALLMGSRTNTLCLMAACSTFLRFLYFFLLCSKRQENRPHVSRINLEVTV